MVNIVKFSSFSIERKGKRKKMAWYTSVAVLVITNREEETRVKERDASGREGENDRGGEGGRRGEREMRRAL